MAKSAGVHAMSLFLIRKSSSTLVKQALKQEALTAQKGFSLLELVIALTIFVVLMIATVNVVKTLREYDHLLENERYMTSVKGAFMTFVKVNQFLPCPDTDADADGKENREGAPNFECTSEEGKVPFLDLGVPAVDAWNQPLFYAINNEADSSVGIVKPLASARYFNRALAPAFTLNTWPIGESGSVGNYRICGEEAASCSSSTTADGLLEAAAIAVVVSFGENGAVTWSAINSGTNIGLDDAEAENMDGDQNYWQAIGSLREGKAFDDQLFWLLGDDLKYAIMSSGGTL